MKITSKDFWYLTLLLVFALPLILYAYNFGVGLWDSHAKWAELGATISGFYTPILSLLTIGVLYRQTNILEKQSILKSNFEKIENHKSKVSEMLLTLKEDINNLNDDQKINFYRFSTIAPSKLMLTHNTADDSLIKLAFTWNSICSHIHSFVVSKDQNMNDLASFQKNDLIIQLGMKNCFALDHLMLVVFKGYDIKKTFFISSKI